MKNHLITKAAGLVAGAALLICTVPAMAHGGVDWSISLGAPVYYSPPVIYSPPPVVYVQPQPVYQEYAPIVEYRQQPYYVYPERYRHDREWREHRRHHRHDRD